MVGKKLGSWIFGPERFFGSRGFSSIAAGWHRLRAAEFDFAASIAIEFLPIAFLRLKGRKRRIHSWCRRSLNYGYAVIVLVLFFIMLVETAMELQ